MRGSHRHRWDVSPAEAEAIQIRLRPLVETEDRLGVVLRVAGLDVSFPAQDRARAAAVVLELPELRRVETRVAERPVAFPYRPGLFSFREGPAALAALDLLEQPPEHHGHLVGRPLPGGRQAPVMEELRVPEDPERGVRVPDVHRQQHGANRCTRGATPTRARDEAGADRR